MTQANRVYVRTSTLGQGTLALGPVASQAFCTFAESGVTNGASIESYLIEAGQDFEIGVGVYNSEGPTLTRATVRLSRIGGVVSTTKMNLQGNATVRVTVAAEDIENLTTDAELGAALALKLTASNNLLDVSSVVAARANLSVREVLSTDRTYYVRTNGSDLNNGLANTSGGAFLTLQHAVDEVYRLDLNFCTVTIQVADGTYTAGVTVEGPFLGHGKVNFQGNLTTPSNVNINVTVGFGFLANYGAVINSVAGFKITVATAGAAIEATRGSYINFSNIDFGACTGSNTCHIEAQFGGVANATGAYTISGGAAVHWHAPDGGRITVQGLTITLTGTPAISYFAGSALGGGIECNGNTFVGSATGQRYWARRVSCINTEGGGSTYLPGDISGVADATTFGAYI